MKFFRIYISTLLLVGVFSFGISIHGHSQSQSFEERYYQVYKDIAALDTKEAMRIADSLYTVADDNSRKMRALLLLAEISKSSGDISSSLYSILQAQEIANSNPEYAEWQTLTSGFLASTFREVGLTEQSKIYLQQAEVANEIKRDSPGYSRRKILMQQEKASHAAADSAYRLALDLLREGSAILQQDSHPSARLLSAINDQQRAYYLLEINHLDSAETLLQSAMSILEQQEDSNKLRPYLYRGKAELAIRRGQHDSAYYYLQLITPYIESAANEDLKLLTYASYTKYYNAVGNPREILRYHALYQETDARRQETAKKIWNELLKKLNEENLNYQSNLAIGWRIFFVVMVFFCLFLVFAWTKRRKQKEQYLQLIKQLKQKNNLASTSNVTDTLQKKDHSEPQISPETENRLKLELENLEKNNFFLDKDVSLASLSEQLNTNQRYVSFIVRKYRSTDFNSYLQHYRVHYIIGRIKDQPELLDYKLAYLADLAGFSSHSKFSAIFKNVTGISPSAFIRYTKEELEKDTPL